MARQDRISRVAVFVASDRSERAAIARTLAANLGLEVVSGDDAQRVDLLLAVTDDRLELREPANAHRRGFAVDFQELASKLDRSPPNRREPLAKAFGKDVRTIVDATAGWCHDAFLLSKLGYAVTAVERSPIVGVMLRDGLDRAAVVGARFRFMEGDARTILPSLPPPDAVLLDPMYPPKRKKSARSRKSIELLRLLVGDDDDAGQLFEVAMATAQRRVVVKRADDAPPIAPDPTVSHGGKTVRYDVYVITNR